MPRHFFNSEEWAKDLALLIASIGNQSVAMQLATLCQSISGYETSLIVAFSHDQRPIHVFDNLPPDVSGKVLRPYFDGAYLLDPLYSLYLNQAPDGIYRIIDLAPDNFTESEYYKSYYSETELSDETCIFINIGNETSLTISLGNRNSPKIKNADIAKLQTILPLLSTVCQKHEETMGIRNGNTTETKWLMGAPLDRAFNNFGKDHLSQREREVVQLTLKGHSNKSIARLLDITIDTVKVYNKRFHTKLNISTQAELFSLFLEAISMVPIDSDVDPLTHFFEITSKQ